MDLFIYVLFKNVNISILHSVNDVMIHKNELDGLWLGSSMY